MSLYTTFDQRGIVPIGYAAFAFALGVLAGVLIRRVVPAMATTLVGFVAIRLLFDHFVRPKLITPIASILRTQPGNVGRGLRPDERGAAHAHSRRPEHPQRMALLGPVRRQSRTSSQFPGHQEQLPPARFGPRPGQTRRLRRARICSPDARQPPRICSRTASQNSAPDITSWWPTSPPASTGPSSGMSWPSTLRWLWRWRASVSGGFADDWPEGRHWPTLHNGSRI